MPFPTSLTRSTHTCLRVVWILLLILVPVCIGLVVLTFLKDAEWFGRLKIRINLEPGVAITNFNLQLSALGALAGVVALLLLLRQLLRIVASTMQGDPFIPDNARRLRSIGWLLLGWNSFSFVLSTVMHSTYWSGNTVVNFQGLSLTGLLSTLLIFVLAQIFENGSRMRTELQETI